MVHILGRMEYIITVLIVRLYFGVWFYDNGTKNIWSDIYLPLQDKNPVSHFGRTPLHYAAEAGHLSVVECILDRIITDKNPKDTEGRTPLHFAARQGHVQVVQCIMDRITYKNPRDKRGRTPLWYATENSHTEVIKSIIVWNCLHRY